MLHSQITRLAPRSLIAARRYVSTTTPPSQPAAKKQSDNTLMYVGLGLVTAGGAYFYFRDSDEAGELKERAKKNEQDVVRKSQETVDAAKARANDAYRQGQGKYENLKAEGSEKLDSALSSAQKEVRSAEGRARSVGDGLEAKYDAAKSSTRDTLSRARDSTEQLYTEARSTAERKATEAREKAEKAAKEAKAGWFSWFSWGTSKVEQDARTAEAEVDRLKKEGAKKVANAAEDAREKAQKHT